MRRSARKNTTIADLRGPSTLRSGLVSNPTSKWDYSTHTIDDLEPCEVIGEGKYGIVHKMVEKTTGQLRVVKTVERPQGWDDQQLKLEAEILQNLDHPHILRIFSWYEDGDAVNIVMEHCEGGELMKAVKEGRRRKQELPEMWAATCLRQCFEALVYLHSKGIIHKDLKSANLLLLMSTEIEGRIFHSLPHVVVCDLGLAEVCSRGGIFGIGGVGRAKRVAGTPVTMAPEVWKGSFGPKSDVWSMGCVMFELLTGEVPFRPERNEEALWAEQHRRGPNWDVFGQTISREALHLNELLLTLKESARPMALDVLQNVWLKKSSRQKLSPEELSNLVLAVRQWKGRNPMQRALSLKMAAGCTCLKKFASLFSEFDTDHSGILDNGELLPALESLGLDQALAKEVALSLDVNNDGSCEYLEFAAACLSSLEEEFDELLRQEFNVLDNERKTWLTDLQMKVLIDELKPLADKHGLEMQDIDANGDGVISFSEFFEYFGRPGASICDLGSPTPVHKRAVANSSAVVKQLPMKQHIRIVKEDVVESFISQMQASMEASKHTKDSEENVSPNGSGMQSIQEEGKDTPQDDVTNRILLRMRQHNRGSSGSQAAATIRLDAQAAADARAAANEVEEKEEDTAPAAAPDSTPLSPKRLRSSGSSDASASSDPGSPKQPREASSSGSHVRSQSAEVPSPKSTGSQKALRSLCQDSTEHFISRDMAASQMSIEPPCEGCWLTDGPLKWLRFQGIDLSLGCSRSKDGISPKRSNCMTSSMEAAKPINIEAI